MPDHPDDAASREVVVSAHQRPRAGQVVSAYTRTIHQQEVTFTCAECGRTRAQLQYPADARASTATSCVRRQVSAV